MIDDAVGKGAVRANTHNRPRHIFEYDFGRPIGTTIRGDSATSLRVIVNKQGKVITAFPY